jgi:acyl-CoA synthetase (AMP-forming)/AMP-acid ligase II
MENLAQLLWRQRENGPSQRFGLIESPGPFGPCFDRSANVAKTLAEAGVRPGSRVAVVGNNCEAYLDVWMALQLAGAEAALINPLYPDELLHPMLLDIEPRTVIWIGVPVRRMGPAGAVHIEVGTRTGDGIRAGGEQRSLVSGEFDFPGLARKPDDIAGFMHTSGTSGRPKFCAQSHDYFLRMGRYIADRIALSPLDTIFTPLPLFHINPLGYGIITGLVAGANALSGAKFSASRFWPDVVRESVSVLIMHAPPIEILKKTAADATAHRVRMCFYADSEFLDRFGIPLALSGYGSTEAGGVSHSWVWRRGDGAGPPEGISHYGGVPRPDIESRLSPEGEIQLRGKPATAMFSGYHSADRDLHPFDDEGWFATGDLGRYDEHGSLVFIERKAESLRVNGEYVPIPYVESHFSKVAGIDDAAVWRAGEKTGDSDEVVVFVQASVFDAGGLEDARAALPKFMQPRRALLVDRIPRDPGVGKVRRRELAALTVREEYTFS